MGVGINLSIPSNDFPEELRSRATSLEGGDGSDDPGAVVLDRFLEVFRAYLERVKFSGEVDLDLWRRWMRPGRMVRFSMNGNVHGGQAKGIRPDGALEIEMEDGSSQFVVAGDVTPVTWED
jgi:BirA family biotin operon repressor/biotin-[acetyl-CoA-carboxylase] ligase